MDFLEQTQASLMSRGGDVDPAILTSLVSERGINSAALMSLGIGPGDVHVDQALSNLVVSFDNAEYVADEVLPVVTVQKRSARYFEFDRDLRFNAANVDMASQRGKPGEIHYALSKEDFHVRDYGLMDSIPFDVEANEDSPLDIPMTTVEVLKNYLLLAREQRVSGMFTPTIFGPNTRALVSTARWDDPASDPIEQIEEIIDVPLVRPNTAIFGAWTWKKLRQHPRLLQYIISRAEASGRPTPLRVDKALVAEAFELDTVLVPKARINTGRDGIAFDRANLRYVWPADMAAFIYVNPKPNIRRTEAFGYTLRWEPAGGVSWEVLQWFDRVPGTRGVTYYKVTHSEVEQPIAGYDAGYLFTTCVTLP